MSTRSIIVVTGKTIHGSDKTVRIYKHSDGYPTGNLSLILDSLKKSIKQAKGHSINFGKDQHINANQVVGHLIGESVSIYGVGAKVEQEFENQTFDAEKHLGNQGNLEWIYIVDIESKTVGVYGRIFQPSENINQTTTAEDFYTTAGPRDIIKKGTNDPLLYADNLKPEYQAECRAEITQLVAKIKKLDFNFI